MMTTRDMLDVILQISYPGFRFNLIQKNGCTFLQVECPEGRCNTSGEETPWKGRKWYLSPHSTRSEVVQTAFKAVLTALEHEARENFTYKGATILDPHLDLDNLAIVKSERAVAGL